MSEIIWVEDAGQVASSRVLIDTNVWVFIEGFSQGAPLKKVTSYSRAYEALISNGNTIVINDYIVSEFLNVCSRMLFLAAREAVDKNLRYKDYRRTPAYESEMALIKMACASMLTNSLYVAAKPSPADVGEAIERTCSAGRDFSDCITERFCIEHDLILMTDDADFARSKLRIISANRGMLAAR